MAAGTGDPAPSCSTIVSVVMLARFIVSLNVTVTLALTATSVAFAAGDAAVTVGGVMSTGVVSNTTSTQ